ncbi:MAG: nuclear transport factor 2 family protein [Acidobacteria bacterium]|nr:nuclear transport factor 2 family protein [Acidobacteriota bacterium]
MKKLLISMAVWAAVATFCLGQAQSGGGEHQGMPGMSHGSMSGGDTGAAITKIERGWEAAMAKKDDAAVASYIADNWVAVGPDGSKESKAQFLSEVKSGQYADMKIDSVEVNAMGNIAVATGKAHDPTGKYAYMDVFMRQGGTWKAIASQIGKIG